MIKRHLSKTLIDAAKSFPVVSVIGPRQSGKTTLAKMIFPKKAYVSLETPSSREYADSDPKGFLSEYPDGAILDEIQRAPELLSYIQTIVDEKNVAGMYILTGSQNFLLMEKISQTLAGRTAILELLPFSREELKNTPLKLSTYENYLYTGFYPRIYDKKINPTRWYSSYVQTYIERDLRLIKNITDLNTFQLFLKMCAARTGQILNLSSIANDCGLTHNTVKAWLSILETSFIIYFLKPYHKNFNKRLIKMPKLYFFDVGLACFLLGIENAGQVNTHYLKGNLFETFVISELIKNIYNQGLRPNIYYWRDKMSHEIDCLIEKGKKLFSIEIKSGKTPSNQYFNELKYWHKISKTNFADSYIIYGGAVSQKRSSGHLTSWKNMDDLLAFLNKQEKE